MKYQYPVTILTPAYNRANLLPRLYESLCNQTSKDFQWLIIDDGSTDNTKAVVDAFDTNRVNIEYHVKMNGGKHTALNYSHPYIKGEVVCIVDSDDWLVDIAVEEMVKRKNQFFSFKNVKLITFLRGKDLMTPLRDEFPEEPTISNHIDFRVNAERRADCCEVIDTEVFKEFPFPEFPGERFLGEGHLWNSAGFKYDTVYIKEILYVCEYLEGGLTESGRKLRLMCPNGGMANCNSFYNADSSRKVSDKIRRKEAMLFVCYGRQAKLNRAQIIDRANDKEFVKRYYLAGKLLHAYWKHKYLR